MEVFSQSNVVTGKTVEEFINYIKNTGKAPQKVIERAQKFLTNPYF
jgi:hypothetical protein